MKQSHWLIIIVILIVLFSLYKGVFKIKVESFESKEQKIIDIEQGRINVPPMMIEQEKGLISGGAEFVGLPDEIMTAWGGASIKTEGIMKENNCSKACCSPQYPLPFKLQISPNVGNPNQYVQSNINCHNDWQDSGCLCMTEGEAMLLTNRGGNTMSLINPIEEVKQKVKKM